MGEGIIEASISRWLVSAGEWVKPDQPLVEVATDKVDSEIPSPVEGRIVKLIYREGETPKVGAVIALIETAAEAATDQATDEAERPESQRHEPPSPRVIIAEKRRKVTLPYDEDAVVVSPLVRSLARQRGISAAELRNITGTGLNGRITRDDIHRYLISGQTANSSTDDMTQADSDRVFKPQASQEPLPEPDDELVEMDRLRKLIASHMIRSKRLAPHVTSFLEADVTALASWRDRHKKKFFQQEGARLTYTPIILALVARALKEFPRINVSVSGDSIILRKHFNIGFATALPDGNLIVPVIRNADQESLGNLARKVADLAERARNNALLPGDIKGGTFTVTNIGQYNNLTGTPIINQPESAILAVGTISKKPWAVRTETDYGIAVRDITMLSLTYDHRVIDGALGGSFLSRIAWYLENFEASGVL
jgi:2-oxoglutarate dehydrogenase E2 component (dihydrolipoamide succinyltransferase)